MTQILATILLFYLAIKTCFGPRKSVLAKKASFFTFWLGVGTLSLAFNLFKISNEISGLLWMLALFFASYYFHELTGLYLKKEIKYKRFACYSLAGSIFVAASLAALFFPLAQIFYWLKLFIYIHLTFLAGRSLLSLGQAYRSTKLWRQKSKLKYFGLMMVVSGLFLGTAFSPHFNQLSPLGFLGLGVAVIFSLNLARFPEFSFLLKRQVVYAFALGIFMFFYVIFALSTIAVFSFNLETQLFVSAILMVGSMFSFRFFERYFHKWTDDIFFREKRHYKKLLTQISVRLRELNSFSELRDEVTRIFRKILPVKEILFSISNEQAEYNLDWFAKDSLQYESVKVVLQSLAEVLFIDELLKNQGQAKVHSLKAEGELKNIKQFQEYGVKVVIPLSAKGKLQGYLLLGEKKSAYPYTKEELEFCETLAAQLLSAKFRLELLEKQKGREEQLASLQMASRALGNVENFPQLLDNIVQSLAEVIKVDRGILFLYDEKSNSLNGIAGYGAPRHYIKEINLNIDDSILGNVFKKGRAVYIPHTTRRTQFVNHLGVQSYIAVPMKLKDKVIGLIGLDNKISQRSLETINLDMVETLANQTAIAIENIKLYRQEEDRVEELFQLNRQLSRMEKLSALGTMAAGLAHEIKNPLASLKLFAQMLADNAANADFLNEYGPILEDEVDRLHKIVEDFLGFAKSHQLKLESVLVRDIVDKALILAQAQIMSSQVQINISGDDELTVLADGQHLVQVLLNLIINACQAIPPECKGKIEINICPKHRQGTIEISDNGMGISPENMEKLFTPFFTTKEKGNGLGLAICYKIIEEHGGILNVASQEGKGTTFSILLPLAEAKIIPFDKLPAKSKAPEKVM